MKTCKKCAQNYEGRRCKPCHLLYMNEWNAKNKEKVKKTKSKSYEKHKDSIDQKNKEWAEKNREKSNQIKKNWKIRNKEKYLEQQRQYANNRYQEKRIEILQQRKTEHSKNVVKTWREKNQERLNAEFLSKYHASDEVKKKYKARQDVKYAIARGEMTKPEVCSICNCSGIIEAHHQDYDKPLDVTWLCITCHKKIHSKFDKR